MQNKPASLKKRFLALIIDFCVIAIYVVCLLGATLLFYTLVFKGIPDILGTLGTGVSHLIGFMALTLPIGLYLYLTESSGRHASLGKRVMGISIVSLKGSIITKQQIFIRTVVKLLPWEFAHTFIYEIVYYSRGSMTPDWVSAGLIAANIIPLIYIVIILFRKDHRGPHDLIAHTLVVSAK